MFALKGLPAFDFSTSCTGRFKSNTLHYENAPFKKRDAKNRAKYKAILLISSFMAIRRASLSRISVTDVIPIYMPLSYVSHRKKKSRQVKHNPPKGDRREVVLVFRKSEYGGDFAQIYPKKEKKDNRLKRRNRHAFVGFPKKIFYCQWRSSTLRATGTMVKYVNTPAAIAGENGRSGKGQA